MGSYKLAVPNRPHSLPLQHQIVSHVLTRSNLRTLSWRWLSTTPICPLPYKEKHSGVLTSPRDRAKEIQAQRDLFLSVLSASTTKRDVKSYLSRFQLQAQPQSRAAAEKGSNSPSSTRHESIAKETQQISTSSLRAPETLDDSIVDGLVETFSQLARLGLRNVLVLENDASEDIMEPHSLHASKHRLAAIAEADRLVSALQRTSTTKATRLEHVIGVITDEVAPTGAVKKTSPKGGVMVQYRDILLERMTHGVIPVIPNIGYTTSTQKAVHVEADDVILALTRTFAGHDYESEIAANLSPFKTDHDTPHAMAGKVTLDRLIILDPLGGIPSVSRADKPHIFINLSQEYGDIRNELTSGYVKSGAAVPFSEAAPTTVTEARDHATETHASSSFVDGKFSSVAQRVDDATHSSNLTRHLQNLNLMKQALSVLPTSSSAMLTTPLEAATPSGPNATDLGVGTRRPKNPLIYNLLTDKPLISSSLPVARLHPHANPLTASRGATFVKKGMPLTMIPDPRTHAWAPPSAAHPALQLDAHASIDFPRLVSLIEDSFARPLDTQHYLARIAGRLAGVIVAGAYEGGAILTWELPSGVPDDGSDASRARMVPYLDKFAVRRRSQGAGGVADIVFTAMVRTCLPHGVCWRSRKTNPVNKWYFERSVGTHKIPDSTWTMFWTDTDIMRDRQRWLDYEAVCRSVQPSWADNQTVMD